VKAAKPPRRRSELTRGDKVVRVVLLVAAVIPALALVFLAFEMLRQAYPAIRFNGWHFFNGRTFTLGNLYNGTPVVRHGYQAPHGAKYGIGPLIFGTVVSSLIALVFAVPISVFGALLLVEKMPRKLQGGLGISLELLAGIPSVVFGLWGFVTLGPFLSHHVATLWANHIPDVPVLRFFKGPTGGGQGVFTTGVILSIMILPIIAATTRDLLRQVPRPTVEGALALGMTDSEALGAVTLPWVRAGVIGASVLGLGRALGETIAVAMVSGSLAQYPHSFYSGFGTIAAQIVNTLDSALGDVSGLAVSSLAELALVLVVTSLIANIGARLLVRRVATTALPVGRGI